MNDPVAKSMNYTQWIFELEGLKITEEQRYEETKALIELAKNSFVSLLGLNVMPIEDEDGLLREPKENEITPLSMLVASPEMMQVVMKRRQELEDQKMLQEEVAQEAEMTPEELDAFLQEDGDISFLNSPEDFNNYVKANRASEQTFLRQFLDNYDDVNPEKAKKLDELSKGSSFPMNIEDLEVDLEKLNPSSDNDPFEDLEKELTSDDREGSLRRRKKRILID